MEANRKCLLNIISLNIMSLDLPTKVEAPSVGVGVRIRIGPVGGSGQLGRNVGSASLQGSASTIRVRVRIRIRVRVRVSERR